MSSLQCPATLLVVPAAQVKGLDLGEHKVAHVWSDPASAPAAEAAAAALGVGTTLRDGVAGREALGEIADAHPGETVLVVSPEVPEPAEILADADGWSQRPWGRAGATADPRS